MTNPSTTSSSELFEHPPNLPWAKIWILFSILFLFALITLELVSRPLGHHASVQRQTDLWAHYRDQAKHAGPETIAVLGTSRMQSTFHIKTWNSLFPEHQVLQLSLPVRSAFPLLIDLASDETFRGSVICGVPAFTLTPGYLNQQLFVDFYHTQWKRQRFFRKFLIPLRVAMESRLVLMNKRGFPARFVRDGFWGKFPKPSPFVMTGSRQLEYHDHGEVDTSEDQHRFAKRTIEAAPKEPRERILAFYDRIEEAVQQIQNRGGRVVFVRLMSSDVPKVIEDHHWPKKDYWDVFAARSSAVTVHYRDYPGLGGFTQPDGSHILAQYSPQATKVLADILIEKKIFQAG